MRRTTTFAAHADWLVWIAAGATAAVVFFLLSGGLQGAGNDPPPIPALVAKAQAPPPEITLPDPTVDIVLMVWNGLEHQSQGEWEEALDVWHSVQFAVNADQWRWIAIAQAHMALGDYEEAAGALLAAEEMEPDNAVMHYFRGVLRLEQVPHARDWYDAPIPRANYVAYQPMDVVPNSRAMYRYVARLELQRAIKFAAGVELDQPLTPEDWQSTIEFGPTVGDLLMATGADNFAARAHNILGGLLLEEGALDKAEYHIDQAAQAGMFISYSYVDLIDEFESRGYYLDAARVCSKAVGHGLTEDAAHARAMANVQRAFGW